MYNIVLFLPKISRNDHLASEPAKNQKTKNLQQLRNNNKSSYLCYYCLIINSHALVQYEKHVWRILCCSFQTLLVTNWSTSWTIQKSLDFILSKILSAFFNTHAKQYFQSFYRKYLVLDDQFDSHAEIF